MMIGPIRLPQLQELPLHLAGAAQTDALKLAGGTSAATGAAGPAKGSFSNLLQQAVSEIDGKMNVAEAEKTKVFTGETNNLHQAMIATQEASVAFSLMVEVRNKLVDSYQELMRMQV